MMVPSSPNSNECSPAFDSGDEEETDVSDTEVVGTGVAVGDGVADGGDRAVVDGGVCVGVGWGVLRKLAGLTCFPSRRRRSPDP